ncbi:hypothetical protein [Roseivirga thermotolerans]|uniref:Uncharacterized protein n=1 Tax=Roseivirga thermotolerans TaxID=1758176 RepID=A0ABQ3IBF9_9BACT|nr:hypothetical protein [Roseivirga thermotolerans]GHE73230.1 hypothetical protein GCM10011340_32220 [Roseivirga thermotolerans]
MIVFGRTPEGVFKAFKASISESGVITYFADYDHAVVYAVNDEGLIMVTPSIDFVNNNLSPLELMGINNPKFFDYMGKGYDYRGKGTHQIYTNGKFFNPLGSGGGNTVEPIDPDQALIGTYSILTAFLGFQTYSGDLSASGSSLWMRHVFLDNTYIKVYNRQPDSSYIFNRDLRPDDAEYVSNGHHRFVWSQNQIWALRNLSDDSPVFFEDGQTQKCFKWLKAFKTQSNGGDIWNTDNYDLRSVDDTNFFDVQDNYVRVYSSDGVENNQLGWQIIEEPQPV